MRSLVVMLIAAPAEIAHADGAVDVSAGSLASTLEVPGTYWISNRANVIWNPDSHWALRGDLSATRTYSPGSGSDPTNAFNASLSAECTPDDHWSFQVVASWTPASTRTSSSSVMAEGLPGGAGEADVQLAAISQMTSIAVSAGYDTAGASDHETSGSLTIRESHFDSKQAITEISDLDGNSLTPQQVGAQCKTHYCGKDLMSALVPQLTDLAQFVVDGNITQTEYGVELSLDASYYRYDNDPRQIGFFTIQTVGGGNLGDGVNVTPVQYTVGPSVANRWGALTGTVGVSYGSYLDGQGYDLGASLRLQYKLKLDQTKRMKLYTNLASAWGVDPESNLSTTVSFAFGAKYIW